MANINSVITYNANLSPAQAQIKALTGQIAGLTAAFNTLDKSALSAQRSLAGAFARDVGNIGGFTAQMVNAHNAVENFGKQIAANRLTMRESFREAIAGYTKQNSLMKQLAAQQVRYQQSVAVPVGGGQAMMMTPAALSATGTSAAMAAQKFSIFNQLIDNGATSMLNWGKNTQWAGRQLMVGFTVPLAMLAAVTSKQFRDLDKELTRFQKVYGSDLGGAITESTTRMREQIQQLAFDISRTYGIAAKETAALAADIAATGAEGEQLMESVQQTTRLAVLGEVDRQEAMKATLALQSAFKMNTSELAESINFLNAVENQTSATLEDLATAIPKVGPVIRSLGGDVEDLATLLVAMREGGIPAAEAANALKSGLASLINPTKQASEVAKKFGIDLVGIVEANKGQLMPTIFAMKNALSGLDDFGRARVIEQIFGKYQFARISALFDNIGRTGSQTQAVLELAAKSSTELAAVANQEIKTLTESTAVRFQRAIEDLKNAVMPLGEMLTETLIPIFQKIGEGVRIFADFFQALPEPVKNFAKYGVAIAALAGPVIMLVGLFGNLIANGIKFGMMMVRLGAKITGIRVEKFELLNTEVMAAKLGVDNLTTSFTNQETAMKRLVGTMSQYEASLRRMTTSNPALFIPGAIPGQRGAVPVRRQGGSSSPEKVPGGYGGGDKIPALLEPGEMVVRKEAASQYAPIILAMNKGTIKGFAKGTQETQLSHLLPARSVSAGQVMAMPGISESAMAMARLVAAMHGAEAQILIYTNAVVNLTKESNLALERGKGVKAKTLRAELAAADAFVPLRIQLENLIRETGEFAGDVNIAEQAASEFATRLRAILPTRGTIDAAKLGELTRSAVGSMDPRTSAIMTRLLQRETTMQPKGLGAGNLAVYAAATGQPLLGRGDSLSVGVGGQNVRVRASRGGERIGLYEGVRPYKGSSSSIISPAAAGQYSPTSVTTKPYMYVDSGSRKFGEAAASSIRMNIQKAIEQGFIIASRSSSPSDAADDRFVIQGKNLAMGALNGLEKGFKSTVSSRKPLLIPGPVGGTGIESISNAQKIAQAEKSILALTEKQLPFTARRVRAEVELAASKERIAQISRDDSISLLEAARQTVAENERMDIIQRELEDAKRKELQIQKVIDEQKQKIANADAAQARSEEEEAKNAARRATVSMVGPGGLYGPGGYAAFANVGRRPKPEDVASAPGQSLTDAMDELDFEKDQASKKKGRMGGLASGGTNALLGLSMLTSTITMFSGASSDAANKVMMLSTAVMTLTMAAQAFSGMGLMGAAATGVSKVGGGMKNLGSALAPAGRHAAPGLLSRGLTGMGGALAGGGAAAAGTVAAVAIPLIITAAGLYMYKKSLDEAKERANAAFAEPAKTAEFFGKTIDNVTETLKGINAAGASKELSSINSELRMAVSEDYAGLIEKLKTSVVSIGASDLGSAYTKMIISGMSAEEAQDAIKAIAAEAGYKGGLAYASAFSSGLLEAKTTEEAYQQIIDTISPQAISDQQTAKNQALKQQALSGAGLYGRSAPLVASGNFKDVLAGGPEFVQALKSSIEISQTAPELVAQSLDEIRESYLALNEDAGDILGMGTSAREMAFNEFKDMMGELDDPVINKLLEQLTDSTAETQALAMQMTALGIPLTKAKNTAGQFDDALAKAAIENASRLATLGAALDDAKQGLLDFADSGPITTAMSRIGNAVETMQSKIKNYIQSREDEKEATQESFDAEQKAREDSIDAMQEEMDVKRESYDEEMEQLDKKADKIKKSSDAYIKSLQKNEKADSFYAQQRRTAFGALQKLASGDVFGYLQEREAMSEDARQFSYDKTIEGIEEKRDLELESIDQVREKRQKEQEEYEKMMEDKIDAVQKLMDKESEMHEENMKNYDDETQDHQAQLERRLTNRTNNNTQAKKLIDGIKEGEVQSYEDVTKVFGEELAKRYAELVKNQIASLDAVLKAQVSSGEILQADAEKRLVEMYNALFGTVSPLVELKGGRDGVLNYEDLRNRLGLSPFLPAVNRQPRPGTPAASGGYISGPGTATSDSIPARLSNGEYVVKASSVSKYGVGMMNAINEQRFAEGGPVEMKNSLQKWVDKSKLKFYGGWDSAGSWSKGEPFGMLMHHTAKRAGQAQVDAMRTGYVWEGEFIKGPIVQSVVTADGVGHIIGYGGRGTGAGLGNTEGMPEDLKEMKDVLDNSDANSKLFQIEVDSDGLKQDFTTPQFDTVAQITAAMREFGGWPTFNGRIINHKDWAGYRGKTDTLYPRSVFEKNAENVWEKNSSSPGTGGKPGKGNKPNTGGNRPSITGFVAEGGPGTEVRTNAPRVTFGKATPNFVGARILPSSATPRNGTNNGGRGTGGGNNGGTSGGGTGGGNTAPNAQIGRVLSLARQYQDVPYYNKYPIATNQAGEPTGWGCATSVAWLYKNGAGINLPSPSLSYGQYAGLKQNVSKSNMMPGDLIFYKNNGPSGVNKENPVNHVEMAMGGGQVFNGGVGIQSGFSNHPIIGIKRPMKYAAGGMVRFAGGGGPVAGPGGPRSDSIPAMLSNGEYVVKASSVAKYGKSFLDQVNAGSLSLNSPMSSSPPSQPVFSLPRMASNNSNVNNYGGNTSNNVKIIINGAGGKNATAIANQIASMINTSGNRRNHSRSI